MRKHPPHTRRICRTLAIEFDRAPTVAATRAKVADVRRRRAQLAGGLLDDLDAARDLLQGERDPQRLMWTAKAI